MSSTYAIMLENANGEIVHAYLAAANVPMQPLSTMTPSYFQQTPYTHPYTLTQRDIRHMPTSSDINFSQPCFGSISSRKRERDFSEEDLQAASVSKKPTR